MMKSKCLLILAAAACCLVALSQSAFADLSAGMKSGNPEMKSIGAITFGPEGILFAADPRGASVVAISTGDITPRKGDAPISIDEIQDVVAAVLGTSSDNIRIVFLCT